MSEGCRSSKWILLNVQDQTDFNCQCLNRDLWRDETVKEIIRANFIFVQVRNLNSKVKLKK
jgi:thioredoxin-related protein